MTAAAPHAAGRRNGTGSTRPVGQGMTVPGTVTGAALCRQAGITYRQLSYWCTCGLFGEELRTPGSGQSRRFWPGDVVAAAAMGRVTKAFAGYGNTTGATTRMLAEVASQVRAGATVVRVRLGDHVELTVDVADLREGG